MKSFPKVHGLSIICKALDPVTLQSVNTETSFASIGLSTDAPAAVVTSLSLHRLYCAQRPLWLVSLCCTAASAVAGQFVLYFSVCRRWTVRVVLRHLLWLDSLCCTAASAVAKKAYAGVAVPVASATAIDAVFLVGCASYLLGPPQQSASSVC